MARTTSGRDGLHMHRGFDDNLSARLWLPCGAESTISLRRIIHEMQRAIRERGLRRKLTNGFPSLLLRQ